MRVMSDRTRDGEGHGWGCSRPPRRPWSPPVLGSVSGLGSACLSCSGCPPDCCSPRLPPSLLRLGPQGARATGSVSPSRPAPMLRRLTDGCSPALHLRTRPFLHRGRQLSFQGTLRCGVGAGSPQDRPQNRPIRPAVLWGWPQGSAAHPLSMHTHGEEPQGGGRTLLPVESAGWTLLRPPLVGGPLGEWRGVSHPYALDGALGLQALTRLPWSPASAGRGGDGSQKNFQITGGELFLSEVSSSHRHGTL